MAVLENNLESLRLGQLKRLSAAGGDLQQSPLELSCFSPCWTTTWPRQGFTTRSPARFRLNPYPPHQSLTVLGADQKGARNP